MLEVQLCRRSRLGALIPIGRTTDPDVVRLVSETIKEELSVLRFEDELLDEVATVEREKLARHMASEGVRE